MDIYYIAWKRPVSWRKPTQGIEETENSETTQVYDIFRTPSRPHAGVRNKVKKKTPKRKISKLEETNIPTEKQSKNRPRTPSGQVLTNSIGDIKHMLEKYGISKHDNAIRDSQRVQNTRTLTRLVEQDQITAFYSQVQNNLVKTITMSKGDTQCVDEHGNTPQTPNTLADQRCEISNSDENKASDKSGQQLAKVLFENVATGVKDQMTESGSVTEAVTEFANKNQQRIEDADHNPVAMDVRTIIKMFEE